MFWTHKDTKQAQHRSATETMVCGGGDNSSKQDVLVCLFALPIDSILFTVQYSQSYHAASRFFLCLITVLKGKIGYTVYLHLL